jgi:enhancing lycopene biosynthesis protein 2
MVSTVRLGDGRIPSKLPPPPQPLLSTAEEPRVSRTKVHARAVNNVAIANHATICVLPLNRVVLVAHTRITATRVQACEHTRAQVQLGSS